MTTTTKNTELLQRIDHALDDVRPHLAVDGGNVELIGITEDNIVRIKWTGACEHCSMSIMTLRAGIEQALIGKVPEVAGVEAVNGWNSAT
jgi:Fe-S cluster biogenesis protein NfuA